MVNALSGSGTLSGTGTGLTSAALTGSGTLGLARTVIWQGAAALSGTGTLTPNYIQSMLSGSGTLSISGITLRPPPLAHVRHRHPVRAAGARRAGVSLARREHPVRPPGHQPGGGRPAGHHGLAVPGLARPGDRADLLFTCPGGADKMSCTVMVPAAYRTQLFNPGWQVRITRGGHQVWDGKLDEPVPTASGWTLTAVGTGNRGTDFLAIYSDTWPAGQPDESVNGAITRGLPWANPGVGQPSGAWFGQAVDSGAQTITALLNLVCTRGAMTWYVNSQPGGIPGDDLSVFPLPTVPNRLLVCTTPVARTLGGRHQHHLDPVPDIGRHHQRHHLGARHLRDHRRAERPVRGRARGDRDVHRPVRRRRADGRRRAGGRDHAVLAIYQRASWAGPFTASYGQLLNTGGVPIDPGTDQAGTYVRLILTDYGYGGEVTPQFPVQFLVGAYEWDDFAGVFTVTPYVNVDQSLTGLLSRPTRCSRRSPWPARREEERMPIVQCKQCLAVIDIPAGENPHARTWCGCCTIDHHHGADDRGLRGRPVTRVLAGSAGQPEAARMQGVPAHRALRQRPDDARGRGGALTWRT